MNLKDLAASWRRDSIDEMEDRVRRHREASLSASGAYRELIDRHADAWAVAAQAFCVAFDAKKGSRVTIGVHEPSEPKAIEVLVELSVEPEDPEVSYLASILERAAMAGPAEAHRLLRTAVAAARAKHGRSWLRALPMGSALDAFDSGRSALHPDDEARDG